MKTASSGKKGTVSVMFIIMPGIVPGKNVHPPKIVLKRTTNEYPLQSSVVVVMPLP